MQWQPSNDLLVKEPSPAEDGPVINRTALATCLGGVKRNRNREPNTQHFACRERKCSLVHDLWREHALDRNPTGTQQQQMHFLIGSAGGRMCWVFVGYQPNTSNRSKCALDKRLRHC